MDRKEIVSGWIKCIDPYKTRGHSTMHLTILFAEVYQDYCKYNRSVNKWVYYNGKHWESDNGSCNLHICIKEYVELMKNYAFEVSADKGYLSLVGKLTSFYHRENMTKDARPHHCFDVKTNQHKHYLNCWNGTLNLKTFVLQPHNPDDMITKICRFTMYDPDAKSELWEKFINDIMCGDEEKINYLQKALGYALTGETKFHTCWVLYGPKTRNGKSTLVETISHMLGGEDGYALNMNPETLSLRQKDSRSASGEIARLDGCRFLNMSEPPKKMIFDIAELKKLTGQDSITARRMYEAEFEFKPAFKLFINTNYLPHVNDDTIFTSDRINVITFDRKFEPHEQDKTLRERLQKDTELSGILNWCLEGLKKFYAEGLEPPESVVKATADYREQSDKLGNFIADCLVAETGTNTPASDIYDVYREWCDECGFGKENKTNFYSELKSKNMLSRVKSGYIVEDYKVDPKRVNANDGL